MLPQMPSERLQNRFALAALVIDVSLGRSVYGGFFRAPGDITQRQHCHTEVLDRLRVGAQQIRLSLAASDHHQCSITR